MPWFHPQSLLDKSYEIGIIVKGIDGSLELISALLLLFLSPDSILRLTHFLTQGLLENNPHNFIANHIEKLGHHLASGQTTFAIIFLLTHGLVKVVLVVCLLLNKLWAYPWALGALGLFLIYQAYLLVTKPTFGMAFLSVLDAAIIWLVWREWRKQLSPNQAA
jgi:uncharacterized membrane protein